LVPAGGLTLLRWLASVTLIVVGLSMLGWLPVVDAIGYAGAAIRYLARGRSGGALSATPVSAGLALAGQGGGWRAVWGTVREVVWPPIHGVIWGLLPCGMVYGALFYALLSGSMAGGALVMVGFGVATLPVLVAVGVGGGWLRGLGRRVWLGRCVGALAIVLALALFWLNDPAINPLLCRVAPGGGRGD